MWWAYLLSAFIGGVVALAAMVLALALVSKTSGAMSIHFGDDRRPYYKDMELLESDVRPGGIYVRYKNTGDKHAEGACFHVKVFDNNGQLIAESDELVTDAEILPGQVHEKVLASRELERDWVHNPAHRIDVEFRYGFVE